jgi:hypothetical protein
MPGRRAAGPSWIGAGRPSHKKAVKEKEVISNQLLMTDDFIGIY